MGWKEDVKKTRPEERLYIACSEMDFSWFNSEVKQVINYWNQGLHVRRIAKLIKRDPDEVTILIMSLAKEGKIRPRVNGILGLSA